MKKALNTDITEEMAKELHEKYTKAYPYPEDLKKETIDKKEWYLGNLITLNLDGYPALGRFFVQIWEGDFVVARVYGDSEEEVLSRANAILSLYGHTVYPEGWQLVPKELTNEMRGKFWEADEKYQDGLATMPDAGYKAMLSAAPKFGEEG